MQGVSTVARKLFLCNTDGMKPSLAIRRAKSINRLAAMMGVTRQVVQGWKRRGAMPERRVKQLQDLRPEWFA